MLIERGFFDRYTASQKLFSESVNMEWRADSVGKKVFISHKHADLDQIKGIIGYMREKYGIIPYVDGWDSSMPEVTSGETAERLKKNIIQSDKFLLLATEGAINSMWCNWEVGFGDANKSSKDALALFPLKEKGEHDTNYKGNEYLSIYPYIVYENGSGHYRNGTPIAEGLYICKRNVEKGTSLYTPLKTWLEQ